MKRFFVGCGAVLLILILAGAGLVGYFVYKANSAQQNLHVVRASLEELEQDFPFEAPPEDAPATEALDPGEDLQTRYREYLEARELVGARAMELSVAKKLRAVARGEAEPASLGALDALGAVNDFPALTQDLTEILRARAMSPTEFLYWAQVTVQGVHAASRNNDAQLSPAWQEATTMYRAVERALESPQGPDLNVSFMLLDSLERGQASDVPATHSELVRTFAPELAETPFYLTAELALLEFFTPARPAPAPSTP